MLERSATAFVCMQGTNCIVLQGLGCKPCNTIAHRDTCMPMAGWCLLRDTPELCVACWERFPSRCWAAHHCNAISQLLVTKSIAN